MLRQMRVYSDWFGNPQWDGYLVQTMIQLLRPVVTTIFNVAPPTAIITTQKYVLLLEPARV